MESYLKTGEFGGGGGIGGGESSLGVFGRGIWWSWVRRNRIEHNEWRWEKVTKAKRKRFGGVIKKIGGSGTRRELFTAIHRRAITSGASLNENLPSDLSMAVLVERLEND